MGDGSAINTKRTTFDSASFKVAERDYRILVESIEDYAIVMLGPEGRVETWNAGALALKGYSADEIVGGHFSVFYPEEDRAAGKPERLLDVAAAAGRVEDEGWRVRRDGSRFWASVVITALRDGPRLVGFAKVARDLSDRHRAQVALEEALVRTEEQLRQAQKMEAVGRLASAVAHDFNNVLSVILTYCDLLATDLGPGAEAASDVEEIQKAAVRGARLTGQLLTFSRRQSVTPRVLDLNDVVAGVESLLRKLAGEQISLVFSPGRPLGAVLADRTGLEQVLMNLVVNARDAMPAGGTLTIETSQVASFEGGGERGAAPHAILAVTDTGVGMDDETRTHIFEPFFTTKAPGEGTGLGLATVLGVVKQCGGHIRVQTERGRGTTFRIYLPEIDPAALSS
jgi:PAS domain S-box-containing protein